MNDCSILVCTCDKYHDAWVPFFTLLNKYWKNCPYPIYLNTETRIYEDPLNMNVTTLNSNPKWSWSKRLKSCLKRINSRFVIIILDDFFILSNVRQDVVCECIKWMKNDEIAFICFERKGVLKEGELPVHNLFVERKRGTRYTFNLQAGIWDKNILQKSLNAFESPWEFEEIGNIRSLGIRKKFFIQIRNTEPVFNYNVQRSTGYGLYRGKWLKSNVELFSRENISCDFDNLGFFYDESQFVTNRRSFKDKIVFYSKNPHEILKTIVLILKLVYKKMYWFLENIYYRCLSFATKD